MMSMDPNKTGVMEALSEIAPERPTRSSFHTQGSTTDRRAILWKSTRVWLDLSQGNHRSEVGTIRDRTFLPCACRRMIADRSLDDPPRLPYLEGQRRGLA